jgi:hypothetical protein
VARDLTILAGHGMSEAASEWLDLEEWPVHIMDVGPDDPEALEVLAADNELPGFGVVNDRKRTELLKEVYAKRGEAGLRGTGYTPQMLANLAFVSRNRDEIKDHNEAMHWVGMPDYEPQTEPLKCVVSFRSEEDRQEFARLLNLNLSVGKRSVATWWPYKMREDHKNLLYDG